MTSAGSYDVFVASYDASGAHRWSRSFGGSQWDGSSGVAADAQGNAFVTGSFSGTVDFGGGPVTGTGTDIFVASYGADGTHRWSRHFGNPDGDLESGGVAVDTSGNVFISGYFDKTVDFGGGPLTSAGTYDVFLLRLSP